MGAFIGRGIGKGIRGTVRRGIGNNVGLRVGSGAGAGLIGVCVLEDNLRQVDPQTLVKVMMICSYDFRDAHQLGMMSFIFQLVEYQSKSLGPKQMAVLF